MDTHRPTSSSSQKINDCKLIETYKSALAQQLEHEEESDQQTSESLDSGDSSLLNPTLLFTHTLTQLFPVSILLLCATY